MSERLLVKEWEVSAFDRVKNEWTTTTNHSYESVPEITPVEALSVRPTGMVAE